MATRMEAHPFRWVW